VAGEVVNSPEVNSPVDRAPVVSPIVGTPPDV